MLFASLLHVWHSVVACLEDQNLLFIFSDKALPACRLVARCAHGNSQRLGGLDPTRGWSPCPSLLKSGEVFQDDIFLSTLLY